MIWTQAFWAGAAERALRTFLQTWVAVFGVDTATDLTFHTWETALALPWQSATITAAIATLFSVLMSVSNADFIAGQPDRTGATAVTDRN